LNAPATYERHRIRKATANLRGKTVLRGDRGLRWEALVVPRLTDPIGSLATCCQAITSSAKKNIPHHMTTFLDGHMTPTKLVGPDLQPRVHTPFALQVASNERRQDLRQALSTLAPRQLAKNTQTCVRRHNRRQGPLPAGTVQVSIGPTAQNRHHQLCKRARPRLQVATGSVELRSDRKHGGAMCAGRVAPPDHLLRHGRRPTLNRSGQSLQPRILRTSQSQRLPARQPPLHGWRNGCRTSCGCPLTNGEKLRKSC